MTLPDASGITGRQYTIKKIDTSANAVRALTTGGQTIDGMLSFDLLGQWKYITVVSDGNNWMIIGG